MDLNQKGFLRMGFKSKGLLEDGLQNQKGFLRKGFRIKRAF